MSNKTNDMIRYTAFKMFVEVGYEATNIRSICEEVKIKPSSLYFYYKSKQELFFSIYDEVWEEKLNISKNIDELGSDIPPNMKLYFLYKGFMDYYCQNIIKMKFLFRYHLFPPEDIADIIREKYREWTSKEDELIQDMIKQCVEGGVLSDERSLSDYVYEYKKFERSQLFELIISNTRKNDMEIYNCWLKFWNCSMLSSN
ncbi:TetR/AcrR family transcriptional regulator [Lutispora thermophila]|uniref:Transcriptional regulator, TetR family n=1 Tax=Lutispora thermophila DSM 19022 TaxID=1122184 RepID=A0A1M6DV17_9FIRM|nr:TetR/AcrR family transcriptional regulator [Lutispora thermophila]SHI76993.1 transcriptional regulator, TetR family [Lutispora thermophila DSM 19022]